MSHSGYAAHGSIPSIHSLRRSARRQRGSARRKRHAGAFLALVLLSIPDTGQAGSAPVSLPGGGTSLAETHDDWTVACRIIGTAGDSREKVCTLAQQQVSGKRHQRALEIVLRPDKGGATGILVLPFGLALAKGVTYQLDGAKPGAVQLFRTCLPAGCVVDVSFDMQTIAAMEKGRVLKLNTAADGGRAMSFSVPLIGFASAYQRVNALIKADKTGR